MSTKPTRALETFPNPNPGRDYVIRFETDEFTCLCPKTGQPDFATIRVEYVPDELCVELKSWKLYLWSYRNEGAFHEAVTNRILDDLVAAVSPAPGAHRGRLQPPRRHPHDGDCRAREAVAGAHAPSARYACSRGRGEGEQFAR